MLEKGEDTVWAIWVIIAVLGYSKRTQPCLRKAIVVVATVEELKQKLLNEWKTDFMFDNHISTSAGRGRSRLGH